MYIWIFQSGEPLHLDNENPRPMRAINLANNLINKGHSVTIWSSDFYHQQKRHRYKSYTQKVINKKLDIRLIPSPGYAKNISIQRLIDHFMLALNLENKLISQKKLPDIAFIGYPPIETAYIMVRCLTKRNIPVLLDIKDQWPSIFVENMPKFLKPLAYLTLYIYFFVAKKTIRNSSGICAISDSFLNWSLKFSNKKNNNFNIVSPLTSPYYHLTLKQKKQASQWWLERGIVRSNTFRIIFIGSFSLAFDFDVIFRAAKYFMDNNVNCEFVLCGDGELKETLKIKSSNFSNIKIIEWIDLPRSVTLSKLSSAYIAPYKNKADFIKSIPNKVIDATKFGLPLLSSLSGEVEKLIKENKVGFFYNDQKSLIKSINLLLNNRNIHKQISKNAQKLYQDKFEFSRVYNTLVDHLENMVFKNE